MADFGSIGVIVKLVGGADVLKQLQDIQKQAKALDEKPFQLKVDVSQVVNANKQVAESKQKVTQADKDAIRAAENHLRLEEHQLKLAERLEQADQKRAASAARAAEATERRDKQSQRELEQQASAMQRGIAQFDKERAAYQSAVEKQAAGFQRGIAQFNEEQQAKIIASGQRVTSTLTSISNGLGAMGGLWGKATAGINSFAAGLTHAGQTAATFAYRMTIVTAPLDILILKSLQFSNALEKSLAKVASQLDTTADHMRSFMASSKSQVMDLQANYGVDAMQSSDALYYLISSGISEKQAQASLEPIAKLSAVAQSNAGIVAQGMVAAFNVFGGELSRFSSESERATYVLNAMFEATKKGRFEFEDFSTQFGRAAEMAHMAGMSFDETAAALAALSQVFTPSQASTTLNSFTKAFTQPVEKAKAAFDALKISLYETIDGVTVKRPFMDVFNDTFDALTKVQNVDAQKLDEIMSALFGDLRGGRGAQFFLDPNNRNLFRDILAQIRSGADSVGEAWKVTSEQISTQLDITTGEFYKFGNSIVENLKPAIQGGLLALQTTFKTIGANPQVAGIMAQFAAAMAIAAPAALVLGTALIGAGGLISAIATLMSPLYLIGFSIIWKQIAPAIETARQAVDGFGGGINGIIATVTELARQLGLISDTDALKIFDKLGVNVSAQGVNAVRDLVKDLQGLAPQAEKIKNAIVGIAEGIGQLIDNIGNGKGILGFFAKSVEGIASAASGLFGLGGGNTANATAGILDTIIGGTLLANIGSMVVGALAKLNIGLMNVTAGNVNLVSATGNLFDKMFPSEGQGFFGALFGTAFVATIAVAISAAISAAITKATQDVYDKQGLPAPAPGIAGAGGFYVPPSSDGTFLGKPIYPTPTPIVADRSYDNIESERSSAAYGNITESAYKAGASLGALIPNVMSAAGAIGKMSDAAIDAANKLGSINPVQAILDYNFAPQPLSVQERRFGGVYDALDAYQYTPEDVAALEKGSKDLNTVMGYYAAAAAPVEKLGKSASKTATSLENAAAKISDTIKNLVKNAMSPSAVTDADMAAAENGTYKDKPDEFRRRLEAVAAGTDPNTYGADFVAKYEKLQQMNPGMDAGALAESFKDFSLFANMDGDSKDFLKGLWNWDAVVANVKQGIARIVGEFKLMKDAVAEVVANLTPEDMKGLQEALGFEGDVSQTDLQGAILEKLGFGKKQDEQGAIAFDVTPPDEKVTSKIEAFAKVLQSIKDNSNLIIKIGFDDTAWEKAKKSIDAASEYIQDKLLKYADVFIEITATFKAIAGGVGVVNGSQNAGTGTGGNSDTHPGKSVGGYASAKSKYWLGEQGEEYVIPHGALRMVESMLGGRISSPTDLLRLGQPRMAMANAANVGNSAQPIMIQNAYISVPNQSTLEVLRREIVSRAANGRV